jgi:mRNA-degrading endonuclease RelE of RelBE toxin-antitoxin system
VIVKFTPTFEKYFKRYLKKDKKLIDEFENLLEKIKSNPQSGISLGKGLYKIRLKSFSKGKSGGYRVIYYFQVGNEVIMVMIYSKSDLSNVSIEKLEKILKELK